MNISSGAKVGLIVDTAGGLESTLGPKYSKALERRAAELAEVNIKHCALPPCCGVEKTV